MTQVVARHRGPGETGGAGKWKAFGRSRLCRWRLQKRQAAAMLAALWVPPFCLAIRCSAVHWDLRACVVEMPNRQAYSSGSSHIQALQ